MSRFQKTLHENKVQVFVQFLANFRYIYLKGKKLVSNPKFKKEKNEATNLGVLLLSP